MDTSLIQGMGGMGTQFPALTEKLHRFIERQHMFFTATATDTSRINLSPRSTDWFRVVDDNKVLYLDRTGSGNETAAHMLADGRMTIMFCAVDGPPQILRLYGKGHVFARGSDEYDGFLGQLFDGQEPKGARQMVVLDVEMVQSSCGFGVPFFDYKGERDSMDRWAADKQDEDFRDYWRQNNQSSLDGLPTGIPVDA